MIDAIHVIFYWFRTEQELSYLIPYIYSTCRGLQLIFNRISSWKKNALISAAVLLLVSWDISRNLWDLGGRIRNISFQMLYVLKNC